MPVGLQSWDFISNPSPRIAGRCLLDGCTLTLKDKAPSPQLSLSSGPSSLPLKSVASFS